jgi:soluble lytic murein transglycosylase-like protein
MRTFIMAGVFLSAGWAQSLADTQASAIEKQRAAIKIQVGAITGKPATQSGSFFTVPWIDTPQAPNIAYSGGTPPPCDPIPSEELEKLIEQNAQKEGVKGELIRAVISQESGARPCAVSAKGAQGLMQLMPGTAAQFNVADPFDPKQNVEAGTKLLKQLLTKYNGDVSLALAAYNAGPARVDQQGGVPNIAETMQYVASILAKLPKR